MKKNRLQVEKRHGKVTRYGNDEMIYSEFPNMSHIKWNESLEKTGSGIYHQPIGMERYLDWV